MISPFNQNNFKFKINLTESEPKKMMNGSKYLGHPSHSPQRKHLVKKIVSYFDHMEEEREGDRSRRSRSRSANRSRSRSQRKTDNFREYDNDLHRFKKMSTLKNLMKTELDRAKDGQLDPTIGTLKNTDKGYPSFMRKKYKKSKTKPGKNSEGLSRRMDSLPDRAISTGRTVDLKEMLVHKIDEAEDAIKSEASNFSSSCFSAEDFSDRESDYSPEGSVGDGKLYYLEVKKNYKHNNDNDY